MKPGELVSLHEINHSTGEIVDDGQFLLGSMTGMGSDMYFPSGTIGIIVEVGHFPHLVSGEEILMLLVDGHIGWAYKDECRVLRGEGGDC